jgi:hypothetical protein
LSGTLTLSKYPEGRADRALFRGLVLSRDPEGKGGLVLAFLFSSLRTRPRQRTRSTRDGVEEILKVRGQSLPSFPLFLFYIPKV